MEPKDAELGREGRSQVLAGDTGDEIGSHKKVWCRKFSTC